MRFSMMATYVAVILLTMILLSMYILGVVSQKLHDSERVKLFAKANIVSGLITDTGSIDDQTRFNIGQTLAGSSIRGIAVHPDSRVYFDTGAESDLVGKIIIREAISRCMAEDAQAYSYGKENAMMSVAVPVTVNGQKAGAVYLVESVADIDATVGNIRGSLVLFAVIISLLVAMLSLALSLMTTAPIDNFISVAKEISKGNFNIKAKEKGCSELQEMAKALNYMSSELDNFEQNRKKFVSDVSHELKTPLATIKLICDSLVTTDAPAPEMINDFLGDLSDEVDRLTRLVERLLTLTKMDSAQNSAEPTPVDFTVMLSAIIRKLSPNAESKNIMLYQDFSVTALEPIMLDYDKIWEAVYNIVDNAIKYTPEGGFVKLGLSKKNNSVCVTVEDNGPGIPDSEKEHIFERFYRLDDSRARDTGGTGLGLAIAKEAVQLHGGSIEVKNSENGGSIFSITLPYAVKSEQQGVKL